MDVLAAIWFTKDRLHHSNLRHKESVRMPARRRTSTTPEIEAELTAIAIERGLVDSNLDGRLRGEARSRAWSLLHSRRLHESRRRFDTVRITREEIINRYQSLCEFTASQHPRGRALRGRKKEIISVWVQYIHAQRAKPSSRVGAVFLANRVGQTRVWALNRLTLIGKLEGPDGPWQPSVIDRGVAEVPHRAIARARSVDQDRIDALLADFEV